MSFHHTFPIHVKIIRKKLNISNFYLISTIGTQYCYSLTPTVTRYCNSTASVVTQQLYSVSVSRKGRNANLNKSLLYDKVRCMYLLTPFLFIAFYPLYSSLIWHLANKILVLHLTNLHLSSISNGYAFSLAEQPHHIF